MVLFSVTRLKLSAYRFFIPFLWNNFTSAQQIKKTAGFLGGRLLIDSKLTFWTLTAWRDRDSMLSFRNSGAHRKAMPKLFKWCDEASYGHWEQKNLEFLDWFAVHQKLCEMGKLSPLKNPSEAHLKREFKIPRFPTRLTQTLHPKR